MLILHDPATLAHKTVELLRAKIIPALESPERISAILAALQASADAHEIRIVNFEPDSPANEELLQVLSSTHDGGYLDHLSRAHSAWVKEGLIEPHESILPECFPFPNSAGVRNGDANAPPTPPNDIFARVGFYAFDMSTGISASTYTSALASAHLAFDGVRTLFDASERSQPNASSAGPATVLALCRPPGHHCDTRRAGGYCYLNNAVIAVATYRLLYQQRFHHPTCLSTGPQPLHPSISGDGNDADNISTSHRPSSHHSPHIAILDLDFHHGNGSQEAFYADPDVLYISIHGLDEYPYYTGTAAETGTGPGVGTTLNLPLRTSSSVAQYEAALDVGLDALVAFRPQFVVLSLGFDTFHLDPLGSFKIDTEDYATIARRVGERLKMMEEMGGEGGDSVREPLRCLILLEGGYVIEKLGPNLLSFLRGWEGA